MDQLRRTFDSDLVELADAGPVRLGPVTVTPSLRTVAHDDGRSDLLEPRVMQVLVALVRADGAIVTRDELIERCWGGRIVGEDAIIRTVCRLRRVAEGIGADAFRIETVTKVGYRLVRAPGSARSAAALPPAARDGGRRRRRLLAALALVAAVPALGGLAWWWRAEPAHQRTLMVVPLRVAGADQRAGLLSQSLSTDLSRLVVGNDATLDFADPAGTAATGRRVDFVLSGEARSNAASLDAVVRLVDRRSALILWSREFSGPADDPAGLRRRMATQIAQVLTCAIGANARRPADIDTATLRLFLSGCENWYTDWPAARRYFGQVVARRPDFTQARAMGALVTALDGAVSGSYSARDAQRLYGEAAAEARKALARDPAAGAAYLALATALYRDANWADPGGWEKYRDHLALLERGRAAAPDSMEVEVGLGALLRDVGFEQDALAHYRRAADLEPLGPVATRDLIIMQAYTGPTRDAGGALERIWRDWPTDLFDWSTFEVTARVGDPAKALAMISPPAPLLIPMQDEQWRLVLEARIDPSPARVAAATRSILAAEPAADPIRRNEFLAHLVQIGRIDDAYALAMRLPPIAGETGRSWFTNYMAPFRADPRFLAFARRQGLYDIWLHTGRWPDFCRTETLRYRCPPG